jgi:hypothetical protein
VPEPTIEQSKMILHARTKACFRSDMDIDC